MGNLETTDGGPLPIDLEHLSQYTANDPEVTRDVLGLFGDQVRAKLNALSAADDLEAWRLEAHALKGTALGVGAGELAERALAAEALGEFGAEDHDGIMVALETAADRAIRYAQQLLEDGPFAG